LMHFNVADSLVPICARNVDLYIHIHLSNAFSSFDGKAGNVPAFSLSQKIRLIEK
jgi:hypothetical protein